MERTDFESVLFFVLKKIGFQIFQKIIHFYNTRKLVRRKKKTKFVNRKLVSYKTHS